MTIYWDDINFVEIYVDFTKRKIMGSGHLSATYSNHVDERLKQQPLIAQLMPKTPLKSSHSSNRNKIAKPNAKRYIEQ